MNSYRTIVIISAGRVQVVFCLILRTIDFENTFPELILSMRMNGMNANNIPLLEFQSAGTNVEASLRVLASPGQHSSEVGNEMKCILACIHIQLIQHAIQFMIKLQHPLIAYLT